MRHDGNAEAGFFQHEFLQRVERPHAFGRVNTAGSQRASDLPQPAPQHLAKAVGIAFARELVTAHLMLTIFIEEQPDSMHLAYFFFQRHSGDKVFGAGFRAGIGVFIKGRSSYCPLKALVIAPKRRS